MDATFDERELLMRVVLPPGRRPDFWRNGRVTPAVFKDKKGLSVSRSGDRSHEETVNQTAKQKLTGPIISVTVSDCHDKEVNAYVFYLPSCDNKYHSEIHGSLDQKLLSEEQAILLSRKSVMELLR